MLGLTGERDGPPVQAAGQIADLGGGALMAAFGILAALRERDRSGEGQLVDVSMTDGALSWLAMMAARVFAGGAAAAARRARARGAADLLPALRGADGWVTLGALEPKFWQAWCRGVGREDLIERQFDPPGSRRPPRGRGDLRRAHARRVAGVRLRARLLPGAGARARRGARLRARRAREMVVELDQPGATGPVRALGVPVKLSRTPGDPHRLPGPALGEHTRELLAEAGFGTDAIAALEASGAVAGPPAGRAEGTFLA